MMIYWVCFALYVCEMNLIPEHLAKVLRQSGFGDGNSLSNFLT